MKSPLKKFGFAFHKHEGKEKKEHQKTAKLDELVDAAKDIQDLKNCYDSIISAAATAANNAYEFSEALEEIGTCFLKKTALADDENGGRALMMLGKVHFELQKLFSGYRSHIFRTMVKPSKSLLGELEVLEEMKIQCDHKRDAYKDMLMAHKGGGRTKNAKGETATLKELQEARADYEEEATLFVFRLKSLKQGQFRSLLTQAARQHAVQLSFFRKGLEALEAVDPLVKAAADQQHIEYDQCSEFEDDDSDYDDDDYDDSYDVKYKQNLQDPEVINISRSFEEENTDRSRSLYNCSLGTGTGSQSAPISVDGKSNVSEKLKPLQSSSKKYHSYVLPTPTADVNPTSARPNNNTQIGAKDKWWHSSPLDTKNPSKNTGDSQWLNSAKSQMAYPSRKGGNIHSGPIPINAYSVLSEGIPFPQLNPLATSDAKNFNRQAFSGPLGAKPNPNRPIYSVSDYETSLKVPPVVTMAARAPVSKNHSSVSAPMRRRSPPPMSVPKISELHELPRPPVNPQKTITPSSMIGYSGPLIPRNQALSARNKLQLDLSSKVAPLPAPPSPMTRSFSIPTRGERMSVLSTAKVEVHGDKDSTEMVASPVFMPLSLTVTNKFSVISEIK